MEPGQRQAVGTGPGSSVAAVINEVQGLVWALLDEQMSAAEIARLEQLVAEEPGARTAYVHCMAMHADLQAHCAALGQAAGDTPAPVTPPLAIDALTAGQLRPPVSEV